MDPTETLVAIDKSQLKVEIVDGNLHVSPMDSIPPDLLEAIKANKEGIAEILKLGRPVRLPFPIGFGGLPIEEVTAALAWSAHIGQTDPIDIVLNVLAGCIGNQKFQNHELYKEVVEKCNRLWEEEYGYKYVEDDEIDGAG